jgi:tetratricopeptide (TPR) repeat protein
MRRFAPSLAVVMLFIGISTRASADDEQECRGREPKARIAACTRLLSANPASHALGNRGIAYRIVGDYDRALADIESALRIMPHLAGLYAERGMIFARTGQNTAALRDFDEALRRDANLIQAYFERAMVYEDTGQHERAKADIESALDRDFKLVAGLYVDLGQRLTKAGNYDRAIIAFDKSIEIYPNWLSTFLYRGIAHEAMGNRDLAAADYNKALLFHAVHDSERQFQRSALERLAKLSTGQ